MKSKYLTVTYDEGVRPYTEYPKQLCTHLFKLFEFKKGMKMLESGCGRGEFLAYFQELGLDVCGIDISQEAKEFSNKYERKSTQVGL